MDMILIIAAIIIVCLPVYVVILSASVYIGKIMAIRHLLKRD